MSLTSLEFAFFVVVVWLLHTVVPPRFRWVPLLVASYVFYGVLGWQFTFILAAVTAVNYLIGLAVGPGTADSARRRSLLILGTCAGLAPLVVLKYAVFALGSLDSLARALGMVGAATPVVQLALPLGISFYSFQAVNYTIDVYREKLPPERHFGRFATFVAFFPSVLCGPIGRATDLLQQYRQGGVITPGRVATGTQLILWGVFQKMVVADRIAIYVNEVGPHPHHH